MHRLLSSISLLVLIGWMAFTYPEMGPAQSWAISLVFPVSIAVVILGHHENFWPFFWNCSALLLLSTAVLIWNNIYIQYYSVQLLVFLAVGLICIAVVWRLGKGAF